MQTWWPGSCLPISCIFQIIASFKGVFITSLRPAIAEANFLSLCERKLQSLEALANGDILLNKNQCLDVISKLSTAFHNIQKLVSHSTEASFRPALENLFRVLEKARALVSDCCQEDWCASAVYQIQNERAFQEILLEAASCYKAIYEHAEGSPELEDLTFQYASAADVEKDHKSLLSKLSELAGQLKSTGCIWLVPRKLSLSRHLAQYLLTKANAESGSILWDGASEPSRTWGEQHLLGSGAGASAVMGTTWLGISCAKKVFQGRIDTKMFSNEAGILEKFNHPRVVKFFCGGSCHDRQEDCFIAMELMEMSLDRLINLRKEQNRQFPLSVAIDIIMQIARGMCYLHEENVAHRDLKPLNVVVNKLTYPDLDDEYYNVKLVDFGMSKTKVAFHNTISQRSVGTTMYRAPEVFADAHIDGQKLKAMWRKADVYSFAVTCAQILTLEQPYGDSSRSVKYKELMNGRRPVLNDCPEELASLLKSCWQKTAGDRPPFEAICLALEDFHHKLIREMMGKPYPVPAAKTPENEVKEIQQSQALETSCPASGDSNKVNFVDGDSHKEKLEKTPSTTKSKRNRKDKSGGEKLLTKNNSQQNSGGAEKPYPVPAAKTPENEVKEIQQSQALETSCPTSGDSNKVNFVDGDSHKEKLEKTPSTTKSKRNRKDKCGGEKLLTKKNSQQNSGGAEKLQTENSGERRKVPKGKKLDFETPQLEQQQQQPPKTNAGKRIKRKQALDDYTPIEATPLVPATLKKKRRRGEGANVQEVFGNTVSLGREPIFDGDDEEFDPVNYRSPPARNMKKSRVRRRKGPGLAASV